MSKEYKNTVKFIRHRKLGEFELYIYKDCMSGLFVLQEEETGKRSHNVSYGHTLNSVLPTYNRCVREVQALIA